MNIFDKTIEVVRKTVPELRRFCTNFQEAISGKVIEIKPEPLPLHLRWEATKELLLEGRDVRQNKDGTDNPNKREVLSIVLDTFHQENLRRIKESKHAGSNGAQNIATLNKIILPVVRRILPNLIAHELISVQAMRGPVSQVHLLRGQMIGDRPTFSVAHEIIEAKTRKLAARWTFETASDAPPQQGVDIEAEIMAALAAEVTAEYDQEIIAFLRSITDNPTVTFDIEKELHPEVTPIFVGDVYHKFVRMIDTQASNIGTKTKRGPGNWCIVSEKALLALKSTTFNSFRSASGNGGKHGVRFVGTLNDNINIYCDPYAGENTPVLVGYKGSNIDACAIFSPYVPLSSSGVVIDPTNFEPVVSFMTRYGFMAMDKSTKYFGEAKDYLGQVGFKPEDLSSFI